ncbi:MAG: HEAT repeat domain-containing protein [Planctomycetota bacterium]
MRLGRVHVRLALATAVLAALGGGAVAVLLPEDERPRGQLTRAEESLAPVAPIAPHTPASAPPAPEAPPPPERGPAPEAAPADPTLPPLAAGWRQAVVRAEREQVLAGANALRRAPDGVQQLLTLVEDPHPKVRAFAMRELGRRADPALAPTFRRALVDSSPYVVENARWALARLEGGR